MTEPNPTNKRKAKRYTLEYEGMIYAESGEMIARCSLRDVSETGAQIGLKREAELPKRFILSLSSGGGVRRHCELVWQFSTVAGVKFLMVESS